MGFVQPGHTLNFLITPFKMLKFIMKLKSSVAIVGSNLRHALISKELANCFSYRISVRVVVASLLFFVAGFL